MVISRKGLIRKGAVSWRGIGDATVEFGFGRS